MISLPLVLMVPYTNPFDWARLHAGYTKNAKGVPGLQVDGYFLDDDSQTTRTPGNYYGKLPSAVWSTCSPTRAGD
jgi:hypothetical protein